MRHSRSSRIQNHTLRGAGSLRLRMGWSLSAALVIVMGGMTFLSVLDSRREQMATERTHAVALLDHLAQMSSFRQGLGPAQSELNAFTHYLRGVGVHVTLVPITSLAPVPESPAIAERLVNIAGSPYSLRYTVDASRAIPMLRRTAISHLLYGLVAIAATLGIAEWMLRRYVLRPIGALQKQLQHVGAGRGWLTVVPAVDRELDGLTSSVRSLGPSLERQVWEWIETDRRSNAALVLARLRGRTADAFAQAAAVVRTLSPSDTLRAEQIGDLARALASLEHSLADESILFEALSVSGAADGDGKPAAVRERQERADRRP